MSKYAFSQAERHAIWTVHRERCWLCNEPVSLSEVCIDHIIPESLEGTDRLAPILKEYGLRADFNLNQPGNWLPAHARCNAEKKAQVYKPSILMQGRIERALEKAADVERVRDNFGSARGIGRSLVQLYAAWEKGTLKDDHISQLKEFVSTVTAEMPEDGRVVPTSDDPAILYAEIVKRQDEVRGDSERGRPVLLGPGLEVVGEDHSFLYLRGRTGITGYRPKGAKIDISFDCPFCGPTGWNGTRCIQCGQMIDPD